MLDILYICTANPFQTISGNHQRSNLLCRVLSEVAHVDVVSITSEYVEKISNIENCEYLENFIDTRKYIKYLTPIVNLLIFLILKRLPVLENRKYARKIRQILNSKKYDYIIVRYLGTAIKFGIPFNKKVIIDIDDLPEFVFQAESRKAYKNRISRFVGKLYYGIAIRAAKMHTEMIAKKVLYVFLADKAQVSLFSNALYLPNIPYPFGIKKQNTNSITANSKPRNLLFIGRLDWKPNIYGIDKFLNSIFPIILTKLPQTSLTIAGSYLPQDKKQRWERNKHVRVIGFVEDIFEIYECCNVVVIPLYQGGGTSIKVLETMQMKRPAVITRHAGRGLEDILVDSENILIADDDEDFANKTISLLQDDALQSYIINNACQVIDKYFSYDTFCQIVQANLN